MIHQELSARGIKAIPPCRRARGQRGGGGRMHLLNYGKSHFIQGSESVRRRRRVH